MIATDSRLRKDLRLADICAIGLSASIGVSIFSVAAPATQVAGPAMLIALAMAAVPMAIFAVVYSFMTTTVPRTGASYAWPAMFLHPLAGFMIAWLRIVGCAGGLYMMATVFTGYLERVVSVPHLPVILTILTVPFVLNLLGGGLIGRLARVLVVLKIMALGCFIAYGLPSVTAVMFTPFAPEGLLGMAAAVPLLVGLYTGIESAAEAGEEIRDRKKVALGLAISSTIAMLIYAGTFVVTIGTLGAPAVAGSAAPVGEAAQRLGNLTGLMVIVAALLSIFASMNALMMIFARFLFAMGRDGVLPKALGRVNEKFGTPHVAILVAYFSSLACLMLPGSLLFLFLAANLPTMMKYGANCLSALQLLRKLPELHAEGGFGISINPMIWWSSAGAICALLMIIVGATADWRPYALLGAWGVVGLIVWFYFGQTGSTRTGLTDPN